MASIKLRPGSKNYVACYTLPNGQRKQVSTGTSDKHEARQIAFKLEQASEMAAAKTLTRRKAFQLINEIAVAAGNPIFEEESTEQFLKRWLRGQSVRVGTKKRYESLINDFITYLGERREAPLLFLSPRDCNGFKQWLIDKGLADATINGSITIMTMIFEDANKQQIIDGNTFASVSRIKNAKRSQKKAFSLDQFRKLLEKTDGEWKTLIIIAGLSGQRQKDCSTLKWPQVDLQKGTIEFERQKNSDRFTVPMHPKLYEYLIELKEDTGGTAEGLLMPVMATRPATGRESISDIFRNDVLPRIGIVQKYGGSKGSGRTVSEYSFHSLRHSLSTWLNEIGLSETDRMRIVGHADKKVSQQYTHTEIDKVKENLKRLQF